LALKESLSKPSHKQRKSFPDNGEEGEPAAGTIRVQEYQQDKECVNDNERDLEILVEQIPFLVIALEDGFPPAAEAEKKRRKRDRRGNQREIQIVNLRFKKTRFKKTLTGQKL
jgi:hypothetical protein